MYSPNVQSTPTHTIQQAGELVFIDSSSSFDDYNNPMFVISTSSAAGGLPLGVVVTSGESSSIINSAMTHLKSLFSKCSFYGKGSPNNIITDDSRMKRSEKDMAQCINVLMCFSFPPNHVEMVN